MTGAHWPDEQERARRAGHLTTPPVRDAAELARRRSVERDAGRPLDEAEITRRSARLRELARADGHAAGCNRHHEPHQQCVTLAGDVLPEPRPFLAQRGVVTMDRPAALTPAWRAEHVEHGDEALARATRLAESGDRAPADTWALIAGAHYAAANVRAKPATPDVIHGWPDAPTS